MALRGQIINIVFALFDRRDAPRVAVGGAPLPKIQLHKRARYRLVAVMVTKAPHLSVNWSKFCTVFKSMDVGTVGLIYKNFLLKTCTSLRKSLSEIINSFGC